MPAVSVCPSRSALQPSPHWSLPLEANPYEPHQHRSCALKTGIGKWEFWKDIGGRALLCTGRPAPPFWVPVTSTSQCPFHVSSCTVPSIYPTPHLHLIRFLIILVWCVLCVSYRKPGDKATFIHSSIQQIFFSAREVPGMEGTSLREYVHGQKKSHGLWPHGN